MKPGVSVLCTTFARTAMLAELVECFRRQDYSGPLELLIVNECESQTLRCDVPGVSIYNAESVASRALTDDDHNRDHHANRNRLVHMASGPLICLWDDDDVYLPDFISRVVDKLRGTDPAARLHDVMTWDGRFASVSHGHPASAIMRKSALLAAGGYRAQEGDAFAGFWNRAHAHHFFHGRHHHEPDALAPRVIRRVDAERVRLTNPDGSTRTTADFRRAQLHRIPAHEPAGTVTITPAWTCDWEKFVQDHLP